MSRLPTSLFQLSSALRTRARLPLSVCRGAQARCLSTNKPQADKATAMPIDSQAGVQADMSRGVPARYNANLSKFDKWALVYTMAYPDVMSIPDLVPTNKMASARDKIRTKAAAYLTILCLSTCIVVCVVGSRRRRNHTGMELSDYVDQKVGITTKK